MSSHSDSPPRRHQFFILGLWLEPGDRPAWRISLENPRTAQRSGFTSLAALDAFLAAWMEERANEERAVIRDER